MIATDSQIRDTLDLFIARHQKVFEQHNVSIESLTIHSGKYIYNYTSETELSDQVKSEVEASIRAVNLYSKFLKG